MIGCANDTWFALILASCFWHLRGLDHSADNLSHIVRLSFMTGYGGEGTLERRLASIIGEDRDHRHFRTIVLASFLASFARFVQREAAFLRALH